MGKLLEVLTGYTIWPKNRDPRVKGPQPRVVSSAAAEALQRMKEQGKDNAPTAVCREGTPLDGVRRESHED